MRTIYKNKIGLFTILIIVSLFLTYLVEIKEPKASITINSNHQKLVCIILTVENSIETKAKTAWKTWAKKCDVAQFACNCSNFERNYTDLPIMQLNITESYQLMDRKVMAALEKSYNKYNDENTWFILIDDDTYVFVDNARSFISKLNKHDPLTYGYNFNYILKNGYHSGGGGVLFTPESMKRIANSIKKGLCNDSHMFGDVMIGVCSERSNVTMGNSLDELGRERFHPESMRRHLKGPTIDWLTFYSANKHKIGKECCSEQSITFHYSSIDDMIYFSKIKNESNLESLFKEISKI